MCKRNLDLAVVGGFLCIMIVVLFTAIAYAECTTGDVCVDKPIIGGDAIPWHPDTLISGNTSFVELTINPTAPNYASQYRLYYRCCTDPFTLDPSCTTYTPWQIVTLQTCDLYAARFSYLLNQPSSGCPESYPWVVPLVSRPKKCKLGVQLLDEYFGEIAHTQSPQFIIMPSGSPITPLSLKPTTATVKPGGSATYEISGGCKTGPPCTYWVATLVGGGENYSITTINGTPSRKKLDGPPPVTFTVENTLENPDPLHPCQDTTVIVGVQDSSTGTRASASYVINCH